MKRYLSIAILIWPLLVCGQDIHFSQFFAAPLITNPAQTGNFDGSVRVGGNYRDQWGSVTVPYRTFSVYTDAAIQPKKSVNRFGIGIVALNDQAGDGLLTTNKVHMNLAYHIGYIEKDAVRFAVGLQGGFVQKSYDLSKLIFDSQWNDYTFDPNISNNETGLTEQLDYADVGVGALLTLIPYAGERYVFGASATHINAPTESFLGVTNQVGVRYSVTAGGFFAVNGIASVQPQIYVSTQKKALEVIAGSNFSVPMGEDGSASALFAGVWYRYNDAAWLVGGAQLDKFTFSLSYDVNLSKLRTASNNLGGLELAATYTFGSPQKRDPLVCPAY